jgi:hypothetical protein
MIDDQGLALNLWRQVVRGSDTSTPPPIPENRPPAFDQVLPDRTDTEGDAVSFSAAATDPDGDPLTYGATGLPAGVSIDANGLVSGTLASGSAGDHSPIITVSDGRGGNAQVDFTWTVTPAGTPPGDCGGTVSQETHPAIVDAGSWAVWNHGTRSGGSVMRTSTSGAAATVAFTGDEVCWIAARGPDQAIAEVSIDGGPRQTVDLYASTTQPQQIAFRAHGLGPGTQTMTIFHSGSWNPAATSSRIEVDAIQMASPIALPRIEQTDARWSYTGKWSTASSSGFSDGSATRSNEIGATASISFTGRSVRLIGSLSYKHGHAEVTIDGGPPTTVDLYTVGKVSRAVLFERYDLPAGEHVLTVRVTGNRHPDATDHRIEIDAVDAG